MPKRSRLKLPFDPVALGSRMECAMRESGRHLSELARDSEVDKGKLSRVMRGKAVPNIAELIRICDTIGARVAWVLVGEEPIWADSALPVHATVKLSKGGPKASAELTHASRRARNV